MEIAPAIIWKAKRDIFVDWVDKDTLETVFAIAHEGGLYYALTGVGSLSDWYVVNITWTSFPSTSAYYPL